MSNYIIQLDKLDINRDTIIITKNNNKQIKCHYKIWHKYINNINKLFETNINE